MNKLKIRQVEVYYFNSLYKNYSNPNASKHPKDQKKP
jgi:hypothetical protein